MSIVTVLAVAAASVSGPLAGQTVVLDPGHNGGNAAHASQINRTVAIGGGQRKACDTTGTATASGYTEAAYNLDVARRTRTLLRRQGARVVMTRTSNDGVGPCIDERARIGNRVHADVAVSIHADGGPADGHGFHVIRPSDIPGLTDDIYTASRRLADDVRRGYRRATDLRYATYLGRNGLDERGDLGGLRLSDVPKVFIETGNMANAGDARHLQDPAFRAKAARGIAAGITAFLQR